MCQATLLPGGFLTLPQHNAPAAFLVFVTEPTINFLPLRSYESVEKPDVWKKMAFVCSEASFTQIEEVPLGTGRPVDDRCKVLGL